MLVHLTEVEGLRTTLKGAGSGGIEMASVPRMSALTWVVQSQYDWSGGANIGTDVPGRRNQDVSQARAAATRGARVPMPRVV